MNASRRNSPSTARSRCGRGTEPAGELGRQHHEQRDAERERETAPCRPAAQRPTARLAGPRASPRRSASSAEKLERGDAELEGLEQRDRAAHHRQPERLEAAVTEVKGARGSRSCVGTAHGDGILEGARIMTPSDDSLASDGQERMGLLLEGAAAGRPGVHRFGAPGLRSGTRPGNAHGFPARGITPRREPCEGRYFCSGSGLGGSALA